MKTTSKKSIGKLRRNPYQSHPRAPELTGKLALQRSTFEQIASHFRNTHDEQIECSIAGWLNADRDGKYVGIELSPPYCPPRPANIDELFDNEERAGGDKSDGTPWD
jgi:hypothetical protein